MVTKKRVISSVSLAAMIVLSVAVQVGSAQQTDRVQWSHLSSATGQIPKPDVGRQVATLILDIDKDGVNDFVVASYEKIAWFRRTADGWQRYAIENGATGVRIEAGGDVLDIDGDGDLDILEGAQSKAGEIWWWENPYPDFQPDTPWKRHLVITVGGTHHDQIFGDSTGRQSRAGLLVQRRQTAVPRGDPVRSDAAVARHADRPAQHRQAAAGGLRQNRYQPRRQAGHRRRRTLVRARRGRHLQGPPHRRRLSLHPLGGGRPDRGRLARGRHRLRRRRRTAGPVRA